MNPLVIVIPVVVLLAGVVLFAASRRRDSGGATGALSRETVKRDKPAAVLEADEELVGVSGRQVEASAALDRRPAAPATQNTEVAPFVPPDADAIGISRRKFFNRSIIVMMGLGLSGFGADSGLPVANAQGWLRFENSCGCGARCALKDQRK